MAFNPSLLQNPVAKVVLFPLLTFQNRFLKSDFLFFLLLPFFYFCDFDIHLAGAVFFDNMAEGHIPDDEYKSRR
jgi:hypothetical protein